MDLNKLTDISVWDVRNVYNKVKNVVMNYTEMEIKVNEATGPEPWGASSTLMREIADATFIRQVLCTRQRVPLKHFEEIMTAIYIKFSDTDPSNWRQVYKALQLVEYLVKSGSERVVDDVRGHITIIKMLKNFHHIDASGKDQGINVRQRSREIVDLVQNSDRMRDERQRAKENRDKYSGYSNEGSRTMEGFGGGGSSKYVGFGSDSIGRGGSKYTGFGSDSYRSTGGLYDNGNDTASNQWSGSVSRNASSSAGSSGPSSNKQTRQSTPAVPAKPAEPAVADLFSFDDDDAINDGSQSIAPMSAPARSTGHAADVFATFAPPAAAPPAKADADDDWGDFQCSGSGAGTTSFATSKQQSLAPSQPIANHSNAAAIDLLGGDDFAPVALQPLATSAAHKPLPTTTTASSSAFGAASASKGKSAQKNAFSDIWDMSSGLVSLDSLSLADKNRHSASMKQLSSQKKGAF
ncbi:Epsin-3, clathrin recruitment and traffic between the Golgi and endosome [Coemansia sp. RSA 1694]|nr:Epsin-3, clathrin recruitment and traffic between the Golgi and endosome [Coemansia sp. RSA 1694]